MNIEQAAQGVLDIEAETDAASDMQHAIILMEMARGDRLLDCTDAFPVHANDSFGLEATAVVWQRGDQPMVYRVAIQPRPVQRSFWQQFVARMWKRRDR